MTYPQAIAIRQTRFLPHLDEASPYDVRFFSAFASLLHGRGVAHRFRAFRELLQTGRKRMRSSPTSP
jgi:hypothetical protein